MELLKVLVAEDVADDAELLMRQLQDAGYELHWWRVETEQGFLDGLRADPDIIFSDYSMPQFSGLRALELLRESGRDIPLILVSGTVGEEIAVEAMRFGATDYFLKDRIVRLASAVERALRESRLRRERRSIELQVQKQLAELQRWRAATLGREERMLALKQEVNDLLAAAGKPPRYPSVTRTGYAP